MKFPIKSTTNQARQGEYSRRMPVVLGLSIFFMIVAFGAVYGFTALFAAHQ